MRTESAEFYNAIPVAIRPAIIRRDTLPSEDPKVYDGLLIELWKLFRPKDVLQWLDLKKLHDLIWEQLRYSRIKSSIIESAQKKALSLLLFSMTNERVVDLTPTGNVTQSEQRALDWFTDPAAKKELQELLDKFNYSQDTIDALAFVEVVDALAAMDKMQMSNEARQFAVRRQLEEVRNVLQLRPGANDDKEELPAQPRLPKKESIAHDQPQKGRRESPQRAQRARSAHHGR